jgi:membrane peptidoglycan carboxypeptidase
MLCPVLTSQMQLFRHIQAIKRLRYEAPLSTAYMEAEGSSLSERQWVAYKSTSYALQWVLLYGEDRYFRRHSGVRFAGLWRALKQRTDPNYIWPGGSTITMQLARNLFLSPQKALRRKMSEIVLALQMEWFLPKTRILEIYINVIEMGKGVWGIHEGCMHFYKKTPDQIDVLEAIVLACLLGAPKRALRAEEILAAFMPSSGGSRLPCGAVRSSTRTS